MYRRRRISLALAIALIAGQSLSAQTRALYVSGHSKIHVLQGGVETNSFTHSDRGSYQTPIAVDGDIRTISFQPGLTGAQYTLGGTATGTTYANPFSFEAYDGTTDGTRNYAALYAQGQVYATDRSWANPQFLFAVRRYDIGITYDRTTNSLWTADFLDGTVSNWSMTGTFLGSFYSGIARGAIALAYDAGDQTLWLYGRSTDNLFHQYTTSGVQLATYAYAMNEDVLSAEFDLAETTTPEPASVALLLTGFVAVFGVARNRNGKATSR